MKKWSKWLIFCLCFFFVPVSTSFANETTKFTDLDDDYWAKPQIIYLTDLKVINGFPDDTFRPEVDVTRAQFAAMVARSLQLPDADSDFKDVSKNSSVYKEVSQAAAAGIVIGDPNGRFHPDRTVTRAEMAIMLERALQLKGDFPKVAELSYDDKNSIGRSARESIERLTYYDIMGANEENRFLPSKEGTRVETSVALYQLLNVTQSSEEENISISHLYVGKVTASSSLRVRTAPSIEGQIAGFLSNATLIDIYEEVNGWYKISYKDDWGYVSSQFVELLPIENKDDALSEHEDAKDEIASETEENNSSSDEKDNASTEEENEDSPNDNKSSSEEEQASEDKQTPSEHEDSTLPSEDEKEDGEKTPEDDESKDGEKTPADDESKDDTKLPNDEEAKNDDQSDELKEEDENNNVDPSEETLIKGTVTASKLNVREEPNTTSERLGQLLKGTVINIEKKDGDWLEIQFQGKPAYVHKNFVEIHDVVKGGTLNNKVIVIDAGHGGKDPGAVTDDLYEKEVALKVSLLLQEKLEEEGALVIMTRDDDTYLTLDERVEVANRTNADIFISVHANAATNPSANGVETFWNHTLESEASEHLAKNLQDQLLSHMDISDRGVKHANFRVIRNTKMPSALVELGFMTNEKDFNYMKTDEFYEDAVKGLYNGIVDFFNDDKSL